MARLLTVLSLAAMFYMVAAQTLSVSTTSTVDPSKAVTTTTATTATSTSSMAPTSSMMPSPTPVPPTPTPEPTENNYFINNSDTVCLHMKAGLTIKFTYLAGSENITTDMDLLATKIDPESSCNATTLKASLKLNYIPPNGRAYDVTFHFEGDKTTWNISSILVQFTYNRTDFPGYTGSNPNSTSVSSTSDGPVFNNGPVGLNTSFGCSFNRTLSNFTAITPDLHVSLFMMDLQVQAFKFQNSTSGEFDTEVYCAEANNTGNKIVPIAVGAALAGLVIVVLIAYLIGRLRNRKKSSYEALS